MYNPETLWCSNLWPIECPVFSLCKSSNLNVFRISTHFSIISTREERKPFPDESSFQYLTKMPWSNQSRENPWLHRKNDARSLDCPFVDTAFRRVYLVQLRRRRAAIYREAAALSGSVVRRWCAAALHGAGQARSVHLAEGPETGGNASGKVRVGERSRQRLHPVDPTSLPAVRRRSLGVPGHVQWL